MELKRIDKTPNVAYDTGDSLGPVAKTVWWILITPIRKNYKLENKYVGRLPIFSRTVNCLEKLEKLKNNIIYLKVAIETTEILLIL